MGKRWSEAEDELLRKHADKGPGWEEWDQLLPMRTYTAICNRRQTLGIQFDVGGKGPSRSKASTTRKPRRPQAQGDVPWTPKQDEALLLAAIATVEATGHGFNDCVMRVLDLVRASREDR